MMSFETKISVPTRDLGRFKAFLASAGCVILDTGERTTTDDGIAAEASLNVLVLGPMEEPGLVAARVRR